jgi:hypothetical protein
MSEMAKYLVTASRVMNVSLLSRVSMDQVLGGFRGAALRLPPGVLERMGGYHPGEPHWYLPRLAVDPALQGRGYRRSCGTRCCSAAKITRPLTSSRRIWPTFPYTSDTALSCQGQFKRGSRPCRETLSPKQTTTSPGAFGHLVYARPVLELSRWRDVERR